MSRLLSLLLLCACRAVVLPPETPADPVVIYIVDEGLTHQGLRLPDGDGWVDYGYGDYDWYACDRQSLLFDGVPALLWPTPATMVRWSARAPRGALLELEVSAAAVARLRDELDARIAAAEPAECFEPRPGVTVVRDARAYWCLSNCNDAVAGWLRALDCRVRAWPIQIKGFRVADVPLEKLE